MESSLEYECSVTQSLPGDYIYVKWWDGGPVFASLSEKANSKWKKFPGTKSKRSPFSPFSRLLGHGGLTVARFRPSLEIGTKQTGYTGPAPYRGLIIQQERQRFQWQPFFLNQMFAKEIENNIKGETH